MEINSVQGANAYNLNSQNTGAAGVEDQNRASARTEVEQKDVEQTRQAFEVSISREAQNLAAEETDQAVQARQVTESQPPERPEARQQASQIINIVA